MQVTSDLKLNTQDMSELASFFDLLAKFDFEDSKKRVTSSQEIGTGFSLAGGEPLLESCDLEQID